MTLRRRRKIDELFLESIEEALEIMLDESAQRSFFSHLEKNCSLRRDEIGRRPDILSAELEKVFGVAASKIERLIVALLYSKLGLEYEEKKEYLLGDYINDARKYGIAYEPPPASQLLDEKDLKIIDSLREDARKTVTQIAKETGLSRPTVTRRLDDLKKQNILSVSAGINIRELGFSTAHIALEIKGVDLKQKVMRLLSRCPRVFMLQRPIERADLLVLLFGEDQKSLRSTIECLRGLSVANLIYVHYSEPPLYPEHFSLRVFPEKGDTTPCGKSCADCINYKNDQCVGCPAVAEYRGPL